MTTRVVNKYREKYDVYIGRGSMWGNPYTVEAYGRDKCIAMYERDIRAGIQQDSRLLDEIMKLEGKTLGCFCKPQACHGDVLVKIINEQKAKS